MIDVRDLSAEGQRLAGLLPAVLLTDDAEQPDRPLLRLLEVLAAQITDLDDAVGRLERDPFVARSSHEALALIAELVGARLLGDDGPTNRRVVASTVRWRRRKGTLATLEEVLTQTSGWPAEVDEGFRSLLVTQDVTETLPSRGWTTLLWDPVGVADPLTRRAQPDARHPSAALDAPREGDDIEEALRRLGAPDALLLAASPRTVDLDGWARPDGVAVRTSRVTVRERDEVELGAPLTLIAAGSGEGLLGLRLDPGLLDGPIAARVVGERLPADVGYTEVHEDPPEPPTPRRPELMTPTDLAADPLAVAAGDALRLSVDGALVVGSTGVTEPAWPLAFAVPGVRPVLRFADGGRPGPAESWSLSLAALEDEADGAVLVQPDPPGGVADPSPVVLRATLSRTAATLEPTPAAAVGRGGATVALRAERTAGDAVAWRRAGGTWTSAVLARHPGDPVTGAVAVEPGTVVRLARDDAGVLVVARWTPGGPAWDVVPLDLDALADEDRPGAVWLSPGPSALLVADGPDAVLVAPSADGAATRAWRLTGLAGAAVAVAVLDDTSATRPGPRAAAAGCVDGTVLAVHGGQRGAAVLDDLWQLELTGPTAGRWTQRRVRDRVARTGGALLATADGLVRIGGAGDPTDGGGLSPRVDLVRLGTARPRWEPLPSLPVPSGPGTLVAGADAAGLRALVWADRVLPRAVVLAPGAAAWELADPDPDAPHAPAEGDAVPLGDDVLLVGPSPLPPSEVVVTVGGRGVLAFLPALDPAPGAATLLEVQSDGSTRTWYPAGTPAPVRLRLGAARESGPAQGRTAPAAPRLGARGRIAWTPLVVRQASLGPWEQPIALPLDDAVALDPRLGRVVLPAALAGVRPAGDAPVFRASYHVGRGAALGAGFAPAGSTLPPRWVEPADPVEPGRFAVPPLPDAPTTVAVARSGTVVGAAVDELAQALLVAGAADAPPTTVVDVHGSPRLAPTTAVLRSGTTTWVRASDLQGYPFVEADDEGVSLTVLEHGGDPLDLDAAPTRAVLTGLAFAGAVELAITGGEVDLRWCDLGLAAGGVGLRVAGAGHHTALLRATPEEVDVVLRLYGCHVARLELPPWVRVVAAGCTFDGGDRTALAVDAPGAGLRLRECTVRGALHAGVLEATACVLAGPVVCDRPDLGWLRRCVASPVPGRRPRSWKGVDADVSFADGRPTWPRYLVLDDNNLAAVLTAGEGGAPPGAHADRGRALRELEQRTDDFLPLGLAAHHSDRTADDAHRMGRRS